MTLGTSDINQSTPSSVWVPEMIYNQGGAYGFDGTTNAVDGTFVFDFTDLMPSGGGLATWYLGVQDDTAGSEATLGTFTLIDVANGNTLIESLKFPRSLTVTRFMRALIMILPVKMKIPRLQPTYMHPYRQDLRSLTSVLMDHPPMTMTEQ